MVVKIQTVRIQTDLRNLPPLGASVLEPRFHLGIGHFQAASQCGPFGGCQILLLVETFLEFGNLREPNQPYLLLASWYEYNASQLARLANVHLNARERRARFLALRRCPVLVRMAYPTGDWERRCWDDRIARKRSCVKVIIGSNVGRISQGSLSHHVLISRYSACDRSNI